MPSAFPGNLNRIRKHFPQVRTIIEAKEGICVTVEASDNARGRRKNQGECALAKACIRQKVADGCLIGISTAWLIKGDTATKYLLPSTVSREITSFDRHHDFAAGINYRLMAVCPSAREENRKDEREKDKDRKKPSGKHGRTRHYTSDVRKYEA